MGDASVEARRAAEMLLSKADGLRAARDQRQAIVVLERALETGALEPDLRAEALVRIADCHRDRNEHDASARHLAALIDDPPDDIWLARAKSRLARADFFRGNHQASIENCLDAIRRLAPTDLHGDYAFAELWLGHTCRVTGLLDNARRAFSDGLAAARRAHSLYFEAACLVGLGSLEIRCGNLDHALWHLDRAVEAARNAGHLGDLGRALLQRAVCLLHRGDHEAARRVIAEMRQLQAGPDDHSSTAHADLLLARIERRLGEDSAPTLARARSHAEQTENRRLGLQVDEEAARLALALGDIDTAVKLFEELAGDRSGMLFDISTDCLEGAARARLAAGDPAKAERSARAALKQAEASGDVLARARCLTTLAEVTGDAQFATEAVAVQLRAGARYDLARTEAVLLRMGQRNLVPPVLPGEIRSSAMRDVLLQADELRGFDDAILLIGEPAVGKSAVAARIAEANGTALLSIDCLGHTPESFREALKAARRSGGIASGPRHVLFLNRVDRLAREGQDILTRELRSRPRTLLLASAGVDLADEVRDGTFSAELLHRLSGATVVVPPYRERPEDLIALAEKAGGGPLGLEVRQSLLDYAWPGNALEIENALREARHRAGATEITTSHLPERVVRAPRPLSLPEQIERLERREILRALSESAGNRTHASHVLGVSRKGLIDRMKRLGLWES